VLDSIFNKQGEGVQFGSIPVADGIQTGAIPLPGPGSSGSLSRAGAANTGQSRQSEPGNTGSFAQATASSYTGAIPPLTPEDEVPGQTDKPRLPLVNARPIILFDRVSKVYPAQPNKPALNNISMTISSGEFVFLVGHSGSGKSTFIRLINHEFTTSSGRLMVAGEDLSTIKRWRIPYLRRNIGCVFQDFKLLPNKSAFQNVAFALEVIGKSKHIIRTQVPEVLRLVGLEDKTNKYPEQLSGGEQQRVSIARAIVNRPPMLICDEPTGNLDPQTSLGIMRLLDRINRTGTTILVATHDREMVDSMRKRVIALENGFLVRDEDKGVYGLDA
jgi:cell division transport system ATP-binding protein